MVFKNLNYCSKFSPNFINQIFLCLNKADVKWWIDQGTLLGFIRDGHPIPWDEDIDISADNQDIQKVQNAMKLLSDLGVKCIFFPYRDIFKIYCYDVNENKDWNIEISLYKKQNNFFVKKFMTDFKGIKYVGSILKLLYKALLQIPLNPGHSWKAAIFYRLFYSFSLVLPSRLINFLSIKIYYLSYGKNEVTIQTPTYYFQQAIKKDFNSYLGVNIPIESEKYLEFKYGKNWKTPVKDWVFWQQDGAILNK